MSLLSELSFASALVYSPRGTTEQSKKSRLRIRDPVKRADAAFLNHVSTHLSAGLLREILSEFLAADVVLVPCPRRAPLLRDDALWPARLLASAMVLGGMGNRVLPCVSRTEPVDKSAFAGRGERPNARRHYETMQVQRDLLEVPPRITIVDDVITKGATLIAAASRVKEAFPASDVRGFALVRTMGFAEVDDLLVPCVGRIVCDGTNANRDP